MIQRTCHVALVSTLVVLVPGCGKGGPKQAPPGGTDPSSTDASVATGVALRLRPIQVAAGKAHTCALLDDGSVRCWGLDDAGRLGTGSTQRLGDGESGRAVTVALGGPATQIAAGDDHTCAMLRVGTVLCWGEADHGRLGYGSTRDIGDDETPEQMGPVPLDDKVVQVVTGGMNTCVLLASGALRCWGYGAQNHLGYGVDERDIGDDEPVTSVRPHRFGMPVEQIAMTFAETCVLFSDGSVRCWGAVPGARRPHDTREAQARPDVDLGTRAVALSQGGASARLCAVTADATLRCWGVADDLGFNVHEIGGERDTALPTPARLGDVSTLSELAAVTGGAEHTCVRLRSGRGRCWGSGRLGQVGRPGPQGQPPAASFLMAQDARDLALPAPIRQFAAGAFHTCALLEDDTVRCWGYNVEGQLGYGRYDHDLGCSQGPPVPL